MLEQFVESEKNLKNNSRRGKFLFTTTMLVGIIFLNGILWSLFAKDIGIGNGDFELSNMVAPVAITETEPATPEPVKNNVKQENQKSELPSRQDNIARIDEVQPVPEKIATTSNGLKARPTGTFTISNQPESDGNSPTGTPGRGDTGGNGGSGVANQNSTKIEEDSKTEEPPVKIKPVVVEPVKKAPITISKGVINGTAIVLPKPNYPAAAKAIHAQGDVSVQVTIDENGNVIAANAINGHPMLKQVSETAARSAKFRPTLLSDQPVKVTGVIIYKFVAQ